MLIVTFVATSYVVAQVASDSSFGTVLAKAKPQNQRGETHDCEEAVMTTGIF